MSYTYGPSKSLARNQDEKDAECCVDQDRHGENHDRPTSKKFPDVRLPHPGEVERGVFAETDEGEDRIE